MFEESAVVSGIIIQELFKYLSSTADSINIEMGDVSKPQAVIIYRQMSSCSTAIIIDGFERFVKCCGGQGEYA